MKLNKFSISTEVSNDMLFNCGEDQVDEYVARDMARELAHDIAKKFPKSVTRISVPTQLSTSPYDLMLPKVRYQTNYRHQMELYILTEDELQELRESIRRDVMMELAADRALALLPEWKNRA